MVTEPGQIIEYRGPIPPVVLEQQLAANQIRLARGGTLKPVDDPLREEPWFNFVLPHEEPKRFHGRRKWRKRHERIYWLERSIGIIDTRWDFCQVLPWPKCDLGWG